MRSLIIAAILAGSGLVATQAMATQVSITTANPVIDLNISETVEARPDIATFTTGVQNMAPTASEAVRANNVQMASVVARLKKSSDSVPSLSITSNRRSRMTRSLTQPME